MQNLSFSSLFLGKYPNNKNVLEIVTKCVNLSASCPADRVPVSSSSIPFDVFTAPFLQELKKHFLRGAGLCQNSAAQYLAKIRATLSEAQQLGHVKNLNISSIASKQLRSRGIFIDPDRLHSLENYQPQTELRADAAKSVRIAQLLALISARTGCRASDVIRLKPSNIRGGLLTYVPKKTSETSGKVCVVPVGPKTTQMIAEVTALAHDIDTSTEQSERAFYERYRRALAHICEELPWDEEVVIFKANKEQIKRFKDCITTHTFRHSFATNMYLDEEVGGDIYAIAQMMGHSSVDMTMSYICVPFNEKKMRRVKYFE